MVVYDVQCLGTLSRDELEILSFPHGMLLNFTADDFVMTTFQSTCVPNEDVVDISLAYPDRPSSTVLIKPIQNEIHNTLSSLILVVVGYVEDLADAKWCLFARADGAYLLEQILRMPLFVLSLPSNVVESQSAEALIASRPCSTALTTV